jgi:hypothetical protein
MATSETKRGRRSDSSLNSRVLGAVAVTAPGALVFGHDMVVVSRSDDQSAERAERRSQSRDGPQGPVGIAA